MKKLLCIFVLTLMLAHSGWAQLYKLGVGVRYTNKNTGVNMKYNLDSIRGISINSSYSASSYIVSAFYERYTPPFWKKIPRLVALYGGGFHTGFVNSKAKGDIVNQDYSFNGLVYGLRGIVGIEYPFLSKKVTLGIEVQPVLELASKAYFYVCYGITGRVSIDRPPASPQTP